MTWFQKLSILRWAEGDVLGKRQVYYVTKKVFEWPDTL